MKQIIEQKEGPQLPQNWLLQMSRYTSSDEEEEEDRKRKARKKREDLKKERKKKFEVQVVTVVVAEVEDAHESAVKKMIGEKNEKAKIETNRRKG